MVHMTVDNEEQLEKSCNKCKTRMEEKRCVTCNDKMLDNTEINPNFDEELFKKLKTQAT